MFFSNSKKKKEILLLPEDCDDNEKITNRSDDRNKPVEDEENDLHLGNEDDVLINNVAVILATVIGDVGKIHPIHFCICSIVRY